MPTAEETAAAEHIYSKAQHPCIVAKKPCGCYVAAHALSERCLTEISSFNFSEDWGYEDEDEDEDGNIVKPERTAWETDHRPSLVQFLKEGAEYNATFEVRPVSFVHSGGLNFSCRCKAAAKLSAG